MSKSVPSSAVVLPSVLEREKIFYWLKRISSITAWRRIFEFYKAWALATENSVRAADEQGWSDKTSLPPEDHVLILRSLAHCEHGVNRLAKGDKRVFKFDANGEFAMAGRSLFHWDQMLERIELGENGINKYTPLWPQFCKALEDLGSAWLECGPHILEPRYLEEPARVLYGSWLKNEFTTLSFPKMLAEVPDPMTNSFVRTGQLTPYSGIWEPIDVLKTQTTLRSLFSREPEPQRPFKVSGAMNYLHGGSRAPQITVETSDDSMNLDTTWRLLWRDDRYLDGLIPEEESGYRFARPEVS